MKNNILRFLITLISYVLLTGFINFNNDNPKQEIAKFISQTQTTMKPNESLDLGPLPQLTKYQSKTYNIQATSPFYLKDFVFDNSVEVEEEALREQCQSIECGDGPPAEHKSYLLEQYDITQLSMVGTMLDDNEQHVALIQTPDVGIVNAAKGEYLGKNYGLIITIEEDHVVVREKYKVPLGWQNRMAILELFN